MTDEEFIDLDYVECQAGWKDILQPVFAYVDEYNKGSGDKIEFLQIKEKFGTLRVYTNFTTDALRELISKAEEESAHVCEYCGSRKDVGTVYTGWEKTVCRKCLEEHGFSAPVRWIDGKGNKFLVKDRTLTPIT